MTEDIDWFLGRDGQQYGPIKNDEMQTLARLGQLRGSDLLWRAGFGDWRTAADVFDLTVGDSADAPTAAIESPPPTVAEAAPEPVTFVEPEPVVVPAPEPVTAVDRDQPRRVESAPAAAAAPEPARERNEASAEPALTQPLAAAPIKPQSLVPAPVAPVATPTAPRPRAPSPTAPRETQPAGRAGGKSQLGLVLAIAVPVLAIALGTALYVFWDDLFGGAPGVAIRATADLQSSPVPATPAPVLQPRAAYAAAPVWGRVQADFPEWFSERMREAERIRRDSKDGRDDDPAVTKYLTESLVNLRRNHASDALSASHDRMRRIAVAFIDNLNALSEQGTAVCYDFISHGEATDTVVASLAVKPISLAIDAQLSAVFEAIREGRTQPISHLPPRKTDYDVLADELVKIGWADNDLKVFSDPRLLARAPPEQVCRLVKDWFRAHLAITDQATQLRLLVESLKPVVAG